IQGAQACHDDGLRPLVGHGHRRLVALVHHVEILGVDGHHHIAGLARQVHKGIKGGAVDGKGHDNIQGSFERDGLYPAPPSKQPANYQGGSCTISRVITSMLISFLPACSKFTVTRLPMADCTWPRPQSGSCGWRTMVPGDRSGCMT